jgi:hypothetical protein
MIKEHTDIANFDLIAPNTHEESQYIMSSEPRQSITFSNETARVSPLREKKKRSGAKVRVKAQLIHFLVDWNSGLVFTMQGG